MKIAIVCFPGVSYTDILNFLSPIQSLQTTQPDLVVEVEYCSYLPMHNGRPGLSLTTSFVGLPLHGFDLLFLPNPDRGQTYPTVPEWLNWINTAENTPQIFVLEYGSNYLKSSKLDNIQTFSVEPNLLSAINAGLETVHLLTGNEIDKNPHNEFLIASSPTPIQKPRTASVNRSSAETKISVDLTLDGTGKSTIQTGIPFLDHMLSQIAKHGLFDMNVSAKGDLEIDPHHTMEDTALTLGEAFRQAAGDRKGIQRMASTAVPMDESLAEVSLDFSGRPYAVVNIPWSDETMAELPTSLFEHFLESFASAARINLFVRVLAGRDNHHMMEAVFKALAKALYAALTIEERRQGLIPSTKEVLF